MLTDKQLAFLLDQGTPCEWCHGEPAETSPGTIAVDHAADCYVVAIVAEVRRLRSDVSELEHAREVDAGMIEKLRAASPRDALILADVYRSLRIACEEIGDNEWDDNLHLSDVISKHLARPAQGEIMRLRSDAWLERALEEMGEPILRHGRGDEFLAILRKHRDGKA